MKIGVLEIWVLDIAKIQGDFVIRGDQIWSTKGTGKLDPERTDDQIVHLRRLAGIEKP